MSDVTEPVANDPLSEKVKTRQIETLYRNMPLSIISMAAIAAMVTIVLWPVLPQGNLLAWLLAMMLVALVRGLDHVDFRRNRSRLNLRVWEKRFLIGIAASGIVWGTTAIVLFPADAIGYQYFIAVVIVGVASSAIAIYPVHFLAFNVFFLSALLPLIFRLLSSSDQAQNGLGYMAVLFILYVCLHAHNTNRSLLAAFRMDYKNLDLIEELRRQKIAVEQASAEKSRFIAAANHDIRQPLHALNLLVSAMENEGEEEKKQYIHKSIHRCVECVRVLFDSLMDVSRLDGGDVTPVIQHFRAQDILKELQILFKPMAAEKGLRLEIEESPLVLHTDQHLLLRILKNLISNAIKYTERGTVWVSVTDEDEYARIVVADTGIGIPEEFREQVYQEFFQINNSASDHNRGLGLGLSIVQRLAQIIGCPVSYESECAKGTRFSVQVPLGSHQQLESEPVSKNRNNSLIDGLSILVIDDESDVLSAMVLLLQRWGCHVAAADSITVAKEVLDKWDRVPDVIVADYILDSEMSGPVAVQMINEYLGKDVPAVLVTGDTVVDRRCQSGEKTFAILHKPIMPAQLSLAIQRCYHQHAGRDERQDDSARERRTADTRQRPETVATESGEVTI